MHEPCYKLLLKIFFRLSCLEIFFARSLIVKWKVLSLLNNTSQIFSLCLVGLRPEDLNLSSKFRVFYHCIL